MQKVSVQPELHYQKKMVHATDLHGGQRVADDHQDSDIQTEKSPQGADGAEDHRSDLTVAVLKAEGRQNETYKKRDHSGKSRCQQAFHQIGVQDRLAENAAEDHRQDKRSPDQSG